MSHKQMQHGKEHWAVKAHKICTIMAFFLFSVAVLYAFISFLSGTGVCITTT